MNENENNVELNELSQEERLLELKKDLAQTIVKKLGEKTNDPMICLRQEITSNYLVSEGVWDDLKDIWVWAMLELGLSTQAEKLMDYRERINSKESEEELKALKETILHEIDGIGAAPQTEEQQDEWNTEEPTEWQTENPQITERTDTQNVSIDVSQDIHLFYNQLEGKEKPDFEPFACAFQGYQKMQNQLWNKEYLTVVDFSKSNKTNRLFVINMRTKKIEYAEKVWHWKKSWGEYATEFSDVRGTNKSSLWFYRTPQSITKAHTKSRHGLRLNGIEETNDNAHNRWIYMHPWGVNGSQWCFTLPKHSKEIMNLIKWDSLIFAYYPQKDYFAKTNLIDSKPERLVA